MLWRNSTANVYTAMQTHERADNVDACCEDTPTCRECLASGSPDVDSWAERWSSAHGSVPAGSWESSGGRPGTPPAAGAAVPAQTGPPSPRSASPVPARASNSSHQSSTGRGQMSSTCHSIEALQVGEKPSPTQKNLKGTKCSCWDKHRQRGAKGGKWAAQLPLSLVQAQ